MVSQLSRLLALLVVFDLVMNFAAAARSGRRELQQILADASHSTSLSFHIKSNTSNTSEVKGNSSEVCTLICILVGVGKLCLAAWKGGAFIHVLTHAAAAHGVTAAHFAHPWLANWVSTHGVAYALHMGCMTARGAAVVFGFYITFWAKILSILKDFKSMSARHKNCIACIDACPETMPFTKREIERCFHWQSAAVPCDVHTCQGELNVHAMEYRLANPGVSSFDGQDAKSLGKLGLKIAATIEGAPFSTELGLLIDGNWKAAASLFAQEAVVKSILWFCQAAGV